MRVSAFLAGATALFAAGAANSATIYNSLAGATANAGYLIMPNTVAGNPGGPLGDSFSVGAPTTLNSITLQLFDATPGDGGSVLVYLVPNNNTTNLPTTNSPSNPLTLTGALQLGSVLDSALPTTKTGAATIISSLTNNNIAAAGRYWIELVSSTDTNNGGTAGTSGAKWAFNNTSTFVGAVGLTGQFSEWETNSNPATPGSAVLQQGVDSSSNEFMMTLNATTTPEPASLALLGAGLVGLGFGRRRRAKKAAE